MDKLLELKILKHKKIIESKFDNIKVYYNEHMITIWWDPQDIKLFQIHKENFDTYTVEQVINILETTLAWNKIHNAKWNDSNNCWDLIN